MFLATHLRLADAGKMPFGVKLGSLYAGRLDELEAWIAAGCPAVRKAVELMSRRDENLADGRELRNADGAAVAAG
ncbi:MAG: hypothetical protein U0840_02030 [Gemmataceae bacterium]